MKTLLTYIALTAISALPFTGTVPPTSTVYAARVVTPIVTTPKVAEPVESAVTKPASTVVESTVAPSLPTKKAFDPSDKSTWPSCAANQIVRADNGQCADVPQAAPAPAPAAVQSAPAAPAPVTGGSHDDWMAAAGIPASDYGYVDFIVSHESGWRVTAENPSGAYGLCQALPGAKMASAGADWATNPITQLRWCNGYAHGAHGGSWYSCYLFWVANRWW